MNGAKPHGLSLGDWVAIIREVRGSRAIRTSKDSIPFAEVAAIDEETDQALQRLSDARNNLAHGRGPKGPEAKPFFDECRANLELFLAGMEFLTEYPLRYVERAARDSILGHTRYHYRQLMGDHPLVPLCDERTDATEIEEGSLYLVDRSGNLHLFRPLLNLIACPECGRASVFCFDTYSRSENKCILKSMEHGHTTTADESAVVGLRNLGLLPTP
jgi:hypothetical protein